MTGVIVAVKVSAKVCGTCSACGQPYDEATGRIPDNGRVVSVRIGNVYARACMKCAARLAAQLVRCGIRPKRERKT